MTEGAPRRQQSRETAARTYARALPIVPVRARGMTVEGADGRRYLDCLSGSGTLALGHNHPAVLAAIRKVLDSGAPLDVPDLATPVEDSFVRELRRTLPPGLAEHARVQFCGPSATEAVETAVALVRAATGRSGIVALTGTERGPLAPGGSGSGSRCPFGAADAGHGELAAQRSESAQRGESARSATSAATDPAGIVVEPVHGDCGVFPLSDAWMRATRRFTAARSIPLIADETRTGVGRTGAFWAVEHSGVTPDVMILSDAIGGSLPLAAVIHHEALAPPRPIASSGPFRGNQLALAAGAATLAHVREHRLAQRAATIGSRLLSQLDYLAAEFACIGEVRGRGLMIGVELVGDREAVHDRAPRDEFGTAWTGRAADSPASGEVHAYGAYSAAPGLAAAVQRECLRRGLIVGIAPGRPSVVRLLPPLTITDEQASAVLDRLADALTSAARAHPA
ncbi:aminotransferase class III-fold pyridoxal phosphate-dependent enzyme [Streptomyces sp. NPDC089424]|uniref:aminotransferase class III-fold pyridoxal phosphate-dependent enzyme n=1 Tax=Streptomyces sp. NPDC089424 TaxID=3365917 RepID=UPI0037FDDB4F